MKIASLRTLDRKIAFSTLVQIGGKILQLVLGALTMRLIAKFLTQHDYGIYASISEYALFFSVLANLGIFAYVVRKLSDVPHDGQLFFEALLLRIFTCIGFFFTGIIFLLFFGADWVFILGTTLFFIALGADFITNICDAFLQAHYQMGRATFALLAGKIIYFLALLVFVNAQISESLVVFFALLILSAVSTCGLSFYFVKKQMKWQWKIRWNTMREILTASLPFAAITIINSLYFRFLPDFAAHYFLTKPEFATFSITFKVAQVVSLFSTYLMFSALPGMRHYLDAKNWTKVRQLYRQLTWALAGVGTLLVVAGTLLSPLLISFLSDKKYVIQEFWFLLPLMLLLAAISYGYDLVLITLFAFNQEKWFLKCEVITLIISVLAFVLGTWLLSSQILVIMLAALLAEFIIVIIGYKKVQNLLQVHAT